MNSKPDIFRIPSNVLFCIGIFDLLRGFMHTFLLTWSAKNIAHLDLSSNTSEQLFLLGVFGISNYLTGMIYLIISKKAKILSPYILIIIPFVYLFGLIGIWSGGIHARADFEGRYVMFVYFAICIATFIWFLIQKRKLNH
jgi:hypothetical protein